VKAVVDTNVAVSAAINPAGSPAEVIRRWRQNAFIWLTSDPLLDEIRSVFAWPRVTRHFAWDESEVRDFLAILLQGASVVDMGPSLNTARDPADNRVLETAVAGGADYIVTGDDDLLSLGSYEGIEVVSPARFLAVLISLGL
jgi:putative PIN family toxin of toxin-antitoxin system